MLSNTSSNLSSILEATEGVQALQQQSTEQARPTAPAFPSPREDNEEKEDDQKLAPEYIDESGTDEEGGAQDIYQLTGNKNFKEMLDRFLTRGHERVLFVQSEIRNERGTNGSLFLWHNTGLTNFERLRNRLYEVQMQIFQSPKGTKFDLSL